MSNTLLTSNWLSRFSQFRQLIVGFSGGLDSTVLLHNLASDAILRPKLRAVHINHGLSPNASSWQLHCELFCRNSGIDFITQSVHFDRSANIEEGARVARYEVFSSLVTAQDCLILGHHQGDQAETVLLQLLRGAGVDGLAAMDQWGILGDGAFARPFLSLSRQQLEHYAQTHQLTWIDDESNLDMNYSRNYLRHKIMPLLVEKWPGAVGNLSRTATHCQQARTNLDDLAMNDCQELREPEARLSIDPLKKLSFERSSNVLRVWLKKNQVQLPSAATFNRLINEVILASSDADPLVSWGDVLIRRYQNYLYLDTNEVTNKSSSIEWSDFPSPLIAPEVGLHLLAKKARQGILVPHNAKIQIRFRQGGEELSWHGQTKQLKKLFQQWGVPPWIRDKIPLVYINDKLAVVVGYAISDLFFTEDLSQAWLVLSNTHGH